MKVRSSKAERINLELGEKKQLVDLANDIRSKYANLAHSERNYQLAMAKTFEPITKKLENLTPPPPQPSSSPLPPPLIEETNTLDTLHATPLKKEETVTFSQSLDSTHPTLLEDRTVTSPSTKNLPLKIEKLEDAMFGITKKKNGAYSMGNFPISIGTKSIHVANKVYPSTPGLVALLTCRKPTNYNESDLENYKSILLATNRHLVKDGSRMKLSSGHKMEIIRILFPREYEGLEKRFPTSLASPNKSSIQSGEGLNDFDFGPFVQALRPTKRKLTGNYIYWDDVNELVDRLCLLHAVKRAGNSNVLPEIYNIEEELREANVII
jgi:hypothetical protein